MAEAAVRREAVTISCHGATLVGIVTHPPQPDATGLLVIVGGPQYRVGSHRQFVTLADRLAQSGVPVLRFDHRGIGDSEGEPRPYYAIDDDIRAAIDEFFRRFPGLRRVVLWGLCDGATAALLYAPNDSRVAGLVLLNPWIDAPRARARSLITHYYRQRLLSASFWQRLVRREVRLGEAMREIGANLFPAIGRSLERGDDAPADESDPGRSESMADALRTFDGLVTLVLAGADLTAATFEAELRRCAKWRTAVRTRGLVTRRIDGADHSFSRPEWAERVAEHTLDTLRNVDRRAQP